MGSHLPAYADVQTPQMFVEFAHVYADDIWQPEHEASIRVMKEYLDRESSSDSLVVSAIMIDDLHIQENTLDINAFIRQILRLGLAPDHVVFEGKLGPVAQTIVDQLSSGLKWKTFKKQGKRVLTLETEGFDIGLLTVWEDRQEWSCAVLSAAWSLCRAGVYDFPEGSIVQLTAAPVYGEKIVSVLHEKYQGVEEKVQAIIRAIDKHDVTKRMDLVFFD